MNPLEMHITYCQLCQSFRSSSSYAAKWQTFSCPNIENIMHNLMKYSEMWHLMCCERLLLLLVHWFTGHFVNKHRQLKTFIIHLCLSAMGNVDSRDIAELYDKCVIRIFKTCFACSNKEHKVKQVLSGNWGLNLHMSRLNTPSTRTMKDLLVSHNEYE